MPRDCKHGRPQGGMGKSRPSPPPPSKIRKKLFGYIGGLFTMWGLFATFYFMVGSFFGLATPPPPSPHKKMSADAHDCKEGSRAFSPEFFCVTAI